MSGRLRDMQSHCSALARLDRRRNSGALRHIARPLSLKIVGMSVAPSAAVVLGFVRVGAALVYPSFFSISVSNPLSSFVLSRLQPYPSPRRSSSFLVFDRPRAYIHERAVVFSENFGGPALRPRARRPGACLRGIAPGLRRDRAGSLAARRRPPCNSVGRGGTPYVLPTCVSSVFCLSS